MLSGVWWEPKGEEEWVDNDEAGKTVEIGELKCAGYGQQSHRSTGQETDGVIR